MFDKLLAFIKERYLLYLVLICVFFFCYLVYPNFVVGFLLPAFLTDIYAFTDFLKKNYPSSEKGIVEKKSNEHKSKFEVVERGRIKTNQNEDENSQSIGQFIKYFIIICTVLGVIYLGVNIYLTMTNK